MPIEITMPKLTDTMVDATLARWLKKEGDAVKPGDMIAEVETDKATQELETFEAGTIAKIVVPEGGKTLVGALIVVIAKPGEDVKAVAAAVKTNAAPAPAKAAKELPVEVAVSSSGAPIMTEVKPTRPSPSEPVPVEDHDEGTERSGNSGKVRVSPLARKIADDKGVDLSLVRGTGPEGRIIKRDVLDAASRPQRLPPTSTLTNGSHGTNGAKPVVTAKLETKTIALTNMRQTIARRLQQSKQTIPHFYVSVDVQMDKLLDLRQQANTQLAPEKLSVTDFIARAVAMTIAKIPQINASFKESEILQHGSVDLGIAVSLEDGLMVPVLRAANTKGVRQISQEIKTLADQARTKKLKVQDMTGSTFTISNMGMYGIKDFQAIVNPPESAILAVGGTEWRPVVKETAGKREIVPAQVMTLTLSADHRVVDGALGAKFLMELKGALENPLAMLI